MAVSNNFSVENLKSSTQIKISNNFSDANYETMHLEITQDLTQGFYNII